MTIWRKPGIYIKEIPIDLSDYIIGERKRKLSKIVDKLNEVEHNYIESDLEYFDRKFSESTKIPKKYLSV